MKRGANPAALLNYILDFLVACSRDLLCLGKALLVNVAQEQSSDYFAALLHETTTNMMRRLRLAFPRWAAWHHGLGQKLFCVSRTLKFFMADAFARTYQIGAAHALQSLAQERPVFRFRDFDGLEGGGFAFLVLESFGPRPAVLTYPFVHFMFSYLK